MMPTEARELAYVGGGDWPASHHLLLPTGLPQSTNWGQASGTPLVHELVH